MRAYRTILASLTALAAGVAAPALAAPAVGLVGDKTLVWLDTDTGAISKTADVSGVDRLLGIDVRPGDNKLYGVAGDGTLVTIDLGSGSATAGAKLSSMLPEGVSAMVDFNPMADRLRVMGSDGTNLRAHPDTGEVTVDGSLNFEAGDPGAEGKPNVVATAYINSFGKPEKTAMYDIDAAGNFLQQTKPNDGTLKTIGKLGIDGADMFAFDVQTTSDGANTAWLVAAGATYKVNIETGAAEKVADISGGEAGLRDLAVLPAM
ncbi:MAG: DUF4394 domain-containing protein [Rhizobiaceae bacterium]